MPIPRSRRVLALIAAVAAVLGVGVAAPGSAQAATTTVWVPKPLCAAARPGQMSCQAQRLIRKQVLTAKLAQLRTGRLRPAVAAGPVGGYSPAQLAKAYGLNPDAATTQTVAIVDAFDDPTVTTDLNTFDSHYGLPAETATTFRVVNQDGLASPLPTADAGWAGEISLDVQAVRGVCHRCKILLVEANTSDDQPLATAVDTAVAMGAKIVSNSYGGPETDPQNTSTIEQAYNHSGVAVLASSGDDGWYGWDQFNAGTTPSDNTPSIPAAYPTVVGVGGTSLYLNADSSRSAEQVWNTNGATDVYGHAFAQPLGAAGSGCSTLYGPQRWQQYVSGYSSLGCVGSRSAVDIAADADPLTGYDIYDTTVPSGSTPGWMTIGGTSLASPLVAAMWALAGGPGGIKYPALSLYGHFKGDVSHPLYDVSVGGTGFCDTSLPENCEGALGASPNNLTLSDHTTWAGMLDCAFPNPSAGSAVLANRYQCYARAGYDGVSGVGTPKGVNAFKPMNPTAAIAYPGTVTHGVTKTFSSSGTTDPFPGGLIVKYFWQWGDGHTTTTTSRTAAHRYATKGTRTIRLTVTDNYGRVDPVTRTITVK